MSVVIWKDAQIPQRSGWELGGNGFTITLHGQWCDHLIEDGPDATSPCSRTATRPAIDGRPRNVSSGPNAAQLLFS